jgi:hypothetical protein
MNLIEHFKLYTLKLRFESDIVGVYTTEEETATEFNQMERKKTRMLQRWAKIFDPEIETNSLTDNELNLIIQNKIDLLNENNIGQQERKFELEVSGDRIIIYDSF